MLPVVESLAILAHGSMPWESRTMMVVAVQGAQRAHHSLTDGCFHPSPSVATVRPAVSQLQKSWLFPDSTSLTVAYLIGAATSTWSQLLVGSSRKNFPYFFESKFYSQRVWRSTEVDT